MSNVKNVCADPESYILSLACSSPLFSTSTTSSASVLCSSDQLKDIVTLAHELLAPLPEPSQIVEENRRIISNAGMLTPWLFLA